MFQHLIMLFLKFMFALYFRDVRENQLFGYIPFSISKPKQLELLNVKNTQLSGPVRSTLNTNSKFENNDMSLSPVITKICGWRRTLSWLRLHLLKSRTHM